ncbi:hypothetical protein NPIL_659731 [Nephila pilipes]|uniref:Uncharacterized protein n=1 Tax=Nephila pilipes TaxID=299642 RepID=A0A8X6P7A5_NEPPI|nr:hypothetical protein NPIL_659731 [Nephila pilipes]
MGPILLKLAIKSQTKTLGVHWDPTELEFINNIKVNRCILPFPDVKVIELHRFCDASEVDFGAVAYCKSQTPDGDAAIKMVTSKSRVTLLTKVVVPRLELYVSVLLIKLIQRIKTALR